MSVAEPESRSQLAAAVSLHRPLHKRLYHLLRRGHLYFGLFLFPWAILYGVTSFLFNHPTAFSDQPTVSFSTAETAGTPLVALPSLEDQAEAVVKLLNERQKPVSPYHREAGEIRYSREFAFATVKTEGQTVSVLFDVKNGGGTIRSVVNKPVVAAPVAPFVSVGPPRDQVQQKPDRMRQPRIQADMMLAHPLHERFKTALPTILERTGFPTGEVTVTSVPDIVFPITADGTTWSASYNPMTGAITGKSADAVEKPELSTRRFLLRLHTAHGYPGEANARWFWAVVVDVMAFVMVFWGLSGLIIWWQIKATRRVGAVVLTASTIAAAALGIAMHSAMM